MTQRMWRVLCFVLVTGLIGSSLPAQEGADLPDLPETGVVVPWTDFKSLLDDLRVAPTPTPVPPPPVDHAFSECLIVVTTDEDEERLRVTMTFSVQVLEPDRWVEVRVVPADLALESARMDGSPARLFQKDGYDCVALKGTGRHNFSIEALVPVVRVRDRWTAALRFPPAPVVSLDLEVPGTDRVIETDGGVTRSLAATADGKTRLRAAITRGGGASVSWYRKTPADARESTVFADVATVLSVGEGTLRGSTHVAFTIHGQGVRSFALEVPADITIIDVTGQGIEDWALADEIDGRRELDISLGFPAEGSYAVDLDFEVALGGANAMVKLPDIVVEGVRRERGYVAVAAATNVEITPVGEMSNAAAVDPSEMPPVLAARAGSDVIYLFKYLRHPVVVGLQVVKHEDLIVKRTIVETARLGTFVNNRGRRLSSARYQVKNNRKQFLAVTLPEGSTLWGAFRDGRPVKASRRDDGAVLVPLEKTALGHSAELRPFEIEVTWFEENGADLVISRPVFRAPMLDVDVLDMEWRLYLPRHRRYLAFRGELEADRVANRLQIVDGKAYRANESPGEEVARRAAGEDKEDRNMEQMEGQQLDELVLSQVAQSNVALYGSPGKVVAGGRARGVLPVRVAVPEEGLQLDFSGRLVVAGEAPTVKMVALPAGWRLPRIGSGGTLALAFVLALIAGLAFVLQVQRVPFWMIGAVVLLCVLFSLSAGHRTAFVIGVFAAASVVWLVRWVRSREESIDEGF